MFVPNYSFQIPIKGLDWRNLNTGIPPWIHAFTWVFGFKMGMSFDDVNGVDDTFLFHMFILDPQKFPQHVPIFLPVEFSCENSVPPFLHRRVPFLVS